MQRTTIFLCKFSLPSCSMAAPLTPQLTIVHADSWFQWAGDSAWLHEEEPWLSTMCIGITSGDTRLGCAAVHMIDRNRMKHDFFSSMDAVLQVSLKARLRGASILPANALLQEFSDFAQAVFDSNGHIRYQLQGNERGSGAFGDELNAGIIVCKFFSPWLCRFAVWLTCPTHW